MGISGQKTFLGDSCAYGKMIGLLAKIVFVRFIFG